MQIMIHPVHLGNWAYGKPADFWGACSLLAEFEGTRLRGSRKCTFEIKVVYLEPCCLVICPKQKMGGAANYLAACPRSDRHIVGRQDVRGVFHGLYPIEVASDVVPLIFDLFQVIWLVQLAVGVSLHCQELSQPGFLVGCTYA